MRSPATIMCVLIFVLKFVACIALAGASGNEQFRGPSFDIVSRPVKLEYGRVFQDLQDPIPLPDSVRTLFQDNVMAITGYHADVVEMTEQGGVLGSIPLYDVYLHHYGAIIGKQAQLKYVYDKRHKATSAPSKYLASRLDETEHSLPLMSNIEKILKEDLGDHQRIASVGGGSGAEERHTPHIYPAPYAMIVEGADAFMPLMHLINSRGSSMDNGYSKLLECPCISERVFDYKNETIDGKPPVIPFVCNSALVLEGNTACRFETYQNGFRCCESGVFVAEASERAKHQGAGGYFGMKFTFHYLKADHSTIPLRNPASCCDVTGDLSHGGNIEYDVKKCAEGEKCIHKAVTWQYLDVPNTGSIFGPPTHKGMSPKDRKAIDAGAEVEIIYAVGHQHVGAAMPIGISIFKDSTNELICHSFPIYGNGTEPGNEKGYIVGIRPCTFGGSGQPSPPRLRRDSVMRIEAFYNTTYRHYGLMSLWLMSIADVPPTSDRDAGMRREHTRVIS